ncbi:MAG: hypothetical protein AAF480_17040 [Actinomycetota bacterium]
MADTADIWLDKAPEVPFEPGILYRLLGNIGALFLGVPALIMLPIAPFFGVPGLVLALWVASWTRRERAWVTPEGIWMRRLPMMKDEFVAWERIDEVALPVGALRSPWLRADGSTRIRLPLFVGSDAFHDAVSIHRPDVLDRTCEYILHTRQPRGRWIEGVWICDAHRKKWCKPCNAEAEQAQEQQRY